MCFIQMRKYSTCSLFYAVLTVYICSSLCKGNAAQNGPVLIYSTRKDIRVINNIRTKKSSVVISDVSEGTSLDFHYELKKLCWTDNGLETLQCTDFNGVETKNKTEVIANGVLSPEGLACDWFTNKLYWTDSDSNHIEVATMTGVSYRKVLFWTDIDQPRAIVLAPMDGLMFWTDWGEFPKIERAGMNGDLATRRVIVSEDIYWPNGLTVDYETRSLYWADGKLLLIDRVDFNGENRTRIKQNLKYPYAITKFQTKLFWTDWKNWCIYMCDNSTQEIKELIHSDYVPFDIRAWSSGIQPLSKHPCQENNGGCSHLCLLAPYAPGYTCGCPIGIKLINNFTCADGPQELLVLARRTDICIIYLDSPDYTYKSLNLTNINFTIGVDYDPIDGYIYWTDDEIMKIQRAKLDGTNPSDVITSEIQHPDGIAVDWVARNLYWTDSGTDRIEVATLDGKHRKIIINDGLYEPRAIVVAPQLGWMFWSDWYDKRPKIERANLDGTERTIIVSDKLEWPNGVALDLQTEKLYWCDAKTHTIEYANMDGSDRLILLNNDLPHPFGFTLMSDYLYWTDWQRRSIDRVHKETGASRETVLDQIADVMGLKAIKLGEVHGDNPCGHNNGNCSHFCLFRHNNTYVCKCPIEYELGKDERTCVLPEAFLLYTSNNSIGRISIENIDNHAVLPIKAVKCASSIDFDYSNNRIYWSDSKQRTITRAYINGSDPQRVIELGLVTPKDVAVDWIALNIYWADAAANRIEVARLSGSSRKALLWSDIDEPHSLALDPLKGFMYWSEWGKANCIKKASMDGTNQKDILYNTGYAVGLSLDYEQRRLYWAETTTSVITSSDYNGLNKKIIVSQIMGKPVGLTVYKEFIYWSDASTGVVLQANKIAGEKVIKLATLSESASDLLVYHPSKQKSFNQCAVNNGGCSHLCLALPNNEESVGYTCACPTHYILQNNTCIPHKRFMIYSQRNLAVRLLPDSSDCLEAVLPIQGLKAVKVIDFDPVEQFLYWVEGKTHSIKRADSTGARMSVIVAGNQDIHPFDIAVDALGRLLFWTCATKDVINVTRLENSSMVGVVVQKKGERPRLLVIHQTKRLLFYTDIGSGISTQLIRTRMDGSHRIVITKAEDIAAIAVDTENDLLVWVHGHKIYMCNIDGENQHVFLSENKSRITILSIHSGWLYWLDREINQLQRIELSSGQSRSPILNHASHIVDLVSVSQPDHNRSCAQTNNAKRCSHLCIINGTSAICACPQGLALQEDKKTCAPVPDCGDRHFTCPTQQSGKDCIPVAWRCDHHKDCYDGSDEIGCPVCKSDQFKCSKDLLCIEQSQVCDGIPNCPEGSDEEKCCKPQQFQCPKTDVCIPISALCDGVDNCADGSDELKSVCMDAKRYSYSKTGSDTITIVIMTIVLAVITFAAIFYVLRRKCSVTEIIQDQSEDLLNPSSQRGHIKAQKIRKGIPDVVSMSMINGSQSSSYDRNHITGASSSTNGSSVGCYPRETLNPPPSPATTAASTRGSSPSSRYRPYRHYRSINQPPPPTPCSTDVCDESDYNYPTRSRYDGGPFPPPPTPRSHCHSESCPPSPSSRSSTYFSPLPPPPSPVASPPRGYDS